MACFSVYLPVKLPHHVDGVKSRASAGRFGLSRTPPHTHTNTRRHTRINTRPLRCSNNYRIYVTVLKLTPFFTFPSTATDSKSQVASTTSSTFILVQLNKVYHCFTSQNDFGDRAKNVIWTHKIANITCNLLLNKSVVWTRGKKR